MLSQTFTIERSLRADKVPRCRRIFRVPRSRPLTCTPTANVDSPRLSRAAVIVAWQPNHQTLPCLALRALPATSSTLNPRAFWD
jgi:hypothetical protein